MTRRTARNRDDAPKMTAHHFEYLAWVIGQRVFEVGFSEEQVTIIARRFAEHLKATNPRFDSDVFVDAVLNG